MGIILPSGGADVDHVLHPPGHVLLHLEGHRQGLPHPGPRVRLLLWLDGACAKEVIVCGPPTIILLQSCYISNKSCVGTSSGDTQ